MEREVVERLLAEARRALLASRHEVERDELVGVVSPTPLLEHRGDLGDIAHAEVEREMDQSLIEMFSVELAELDAAEARLAAGTYGRCTTCGEPIDDERLMAVPWVRLCFAHQRERELTRTDFKEP